MSYVVLARKWRPMVFDDVVAQSHITTTLKNAITNNRLASAYLFTGPRGVGKTTTARILAKAINCDTGPTATPCNSCTSCEEIKSARSLNVFEIDGASNRGIDEVRNLRENLRYAASGGKHKIYIIDEVHMLTTEAFNALLKTLEEPPDRVLFIFATTEPHKVPATILSRCQRYDFRRIPARDIVMKLRSICDAEKIQIDDESLHLIARKSEGALRDSQSLLDQVVSFCGEKISVSELQELFGIIDQDFYFECSDIVRTRNVAGGIAFADKVFSQGYDMAEFLNGLAEHFRNILVIKATGNVALLEGMESYGVKYEQSGGDFSETDLLRLIQICAESAVLVKRSANPKLLLETLLIKMIKMDRSIELETLLSSINKVPGNLDKTPEQGPDKIRVQPSVQGNSPAAQIKQIGKVYKTNPPDKEIAQTDKQSVEEVAPKPTGAGTIASLEKIKSDWSGIIEALKKQRIHLGSFLNEGFPVAVHDGILEIAFAKGNDFHVKTINQNKSDIEDIICEHTGFQLKLECYVHDDDDFQAVMDEMKRTETQDKNDGPERETPAAESLPDKEGDGLQESELLTIPMVKQIIEMFDGEVVAQKPADDKQGDW